MSKPILEIQHIGKKYRIQQSQQPYISLRDSIGQWFKPKSQSQDFWALNDISFTVNAGDTIGIIGKNGAGKSTLLKILSRITPPTTGKVISRGRIASLLEVGTGFHPELSGRENVFMNGSILGMRRAEIKTHFDAIVDFAGVAQFIDTPLKHYSSGMQLRLAFAVAAFLQNEILIIDEVLAVGDSEFQKKCLGKMDEVSKSGRTVLFVSHNLGAVESLCAKSVILSKGTLIANGSSSEVIGKYVTEYVDYDSEMVNGAITYDNSIIKSLKVFCDNKPRSNLYMGCLLSLEVDIESKIKIEYPVLGIVIRDIQNNAILGVNNKHYLNYKPKGFYNGKFRIDIPNLPMISGKYFLELHLGDGMEDIEVNTKACVLNIETKDFTGTGYLPNEKLNRLFIKDINWKITEN